MLRQINHNSFMMMLGEGDLEVPAQLVMGLSINPGQPLFYAHTVS